MIRILGVDPGLRSTGWGVVTMTGAQVTTQGSGALAPDPHAPMSSRLAHLHRTLGELIKVHGPDAVAIENVHVALNPVAALALGQARGALMAAAGGLGIMTLEYAPNTVKKAVCGAGKAPKSQVAFMVRRLLPQAKIASQDAVDALAIALCAAMRGDAGARRAAG